MTSVHASPNFANNVYVTHSGYKYNSYIPHIHKSTNNGATWTDISGNLPQAGINDVLVFNGEEKLLFVATDIGVYFTMDGGLVWSRLGNNMPLITVWDLVYNPVLKKLIAGTYSKSLQSIDISSIIPTGVDETLFSESLGLNLYPNPLQSGALHIKMKQPISPTKIRLYTSEGKLLERNFELKGDEIVLVGDGLAAGVYFIHLEFKENTLVKRFVKL